MSIENLLWGMVLVGMTVAYGFAIFGVHAAKQHNVASHRQWMMVSCVLVVVWLVAYVTKQFVFGRAGAGLMGRHSKNNNSDPNNTDEIPQFCIFPYELPTTREHAIVQYKIDSGEQHKNNDDPLDEWRRELPNRCVAC